MSKVAKLLSVYRGHIGVPWQQGLTGIQRVIFAVYDPHDELRMRASLMEFEFVLLAVGIHKTQKNQTVRLKFR